MLWWNGLQRMTLNWTQLTLKTRRFPITICCPTQRSCLTGTKATLCFRCTLFFVSLTWLPGSVVRNFEVSSRVGLLSQIVLAKSVYFKLRKRVTIFFFYVMFCFHWYRLKSCLQEGDDIPTDFTKLFDKELFQMDNNVLPKTLKLVLIYCIHISRRFFSPITKN